LFAQKYRAGDISPDLASGFLKKVVISIENVDFKNEKFLKALKAAQ
jgi:hypothetical protein